MTWLRSTKNEKFEHLGAMTPADKASVIRWIAPEQMINGTLSGLFSLHEIHNPNLYENLQKRTIPSKNNHLSSDFS